MTTEINHMAIITEGESRCPINKCGIEVNYLELIIKQLQYRLQSFEFESKYENVIKTRLLREINDSLSNLSNYYKNKENEWYQNG